MAHKLNELSPIRPIRGYTVHHCPELIPNAWPVLCFEGAHELLWQVAVDIRCPRVEVVWKPRSISACPRPMRCPSQTESRSPTRSGIYHRRAPLLAGQNSTQTVISAEIWSKWSILAMTSPKRASTRREWRPENGQLPGCAP